jgi:hypothetical protein
VLKPPCATDAPGDANLRIEITRTRPAAGAGTPGRRALARGRAGRYTITTGPASSYTPPELDKPRGRRFAIPVPTVPRGRTARPTGGYYARVARAARAASPPAAPAARRRSAPHPEREATRIKSNHSPNSGWEHTCHDGGFVKRTYRPNGDWFTSCLPACCRSALQDFRNGTVHRHFTLHTSSQAPTLHKHRDRDTHAVRCTRSPPRRARGRTRVCRCPA